ncbi:hypothetical protein [Edaphobacter aggregans]|uniref:hypothetical protein n=1 Tax=Edaphobacter aggregans TaxID=570835 RepID=UPI001FE160CA|nr:hypothetical protein [Edaphobacter aggregans]
MATLTPYVGAKYASPSGEAMRQAVNHWIRTTNVLDGFIDFDKATQDPANPAVFSSSADGGDHLQPRRRRLQDDGRLHRSEAIYQITRRDRGSSKATWLIRPSGKPISAT